MFSGGFFATAAGAVAILLVELFKELHSINDFMGDIDVDKAKITLESFKDHFAIVHVNEEYLVFEEVKNGTFDCVGDFQSEYDADEFINNIKVTIRGK